MTISDRTDALFKALTVLRERVAALRFPLELEDVAGARRNRREMVSWLDDYVLPRLVSLEAPLLVVIGGSTGAGKSTLMNAIIGRQVTQPGVLRPTTRAPVLACHPDDVDWFGTDRVLADMVRRDADQAAGAGELYLVTDDAVPPGLALIDAPDIDSVVVENRTLSAQLMAAADLWVFVTTAARYADAVPWDVLRDAAQRSAAVAVVLDRVPAEAAPEVQHHLATLLDSQGLGDSPMFVVEEVLLGPGRMLPSEQVEPIVAWLASLSSSTEDRGRVALRTLDGAIGDLTRRTPSLAAASELQAATGDHLRGLAATAYDDALSGIDRASRDGSLLRGELLARWQDFVGTGEFFRSLESDAGSVRGRIGGYLTGRVERADAVEEAIVKALVALVVGEADAAGERVATAWQGDVAGGALLGKEDLSRCSPDFAERVREEIENWCDDARRLIRNEGRANYSAGDELSGVGGIGVALMVATFASTGRLAGTEVGVAGGTALVAQRLLDAMFGAESVRRMVETVRKELNHRAGTLISGELARFTERIDVLAIEGNASAGVRSALDDVERSRVVGA